jgi:hypothetical protein
VGSFIFATLLKEGGKLLPLLIAVATPHYECTQQAIAFPNPWISHRKFSYLESVDLLILVHVQKLQVSAYMKLPF